MPTYGYECRACGHEFETFQSMRDDALVDCPACGKPRLKRKIGTGSGIIFKGKGFYETDYKRPAAEAKAQDGAKDGAKAEPAAAKKESTPAPASTSTANKPAPAATPGS